MRGQKRLPNIGKAAKFNSTFIWTVKIFLAGRGRGRQAALLGTTPPGTPHLSPETTTRGTDTPVACRFCAPSTRSIHE
jgi:hypothetical protein